MNDFLPKAFDVDEDYCSDYQIGSNFTSPHWHSGAEIIYVISGNVNIMYSDRWHTLKKGSVIFVPPKRLHCCKCFDDQAEKIVIGFSENILGKSDASLSLSDDVDGYCVLHNVGNTELPGLIARFHEYCLNKNSPLSDLMARSFVLRIYAFLISYWNNLGINPIDAPKNKTAEDMFDYIDKNYMNEMSPYDVAKQYNMSYSRLAQMMKEYNHCSFTKYVNRLRIENAKKLLATTDKSVTEVGFECGFSVTSYFIKTFCALANMTPKEYRKFLGEKH